MSSHPPSYRGYRFPREIISHAVWLYHRFGLSFRDVEDLLAERGVTVTYEAIRQWCRTFGLDYARRLRRRRGRMGDTWYLDEVFVKIQGRLQYLWRAVDEDGDTIDILVQSRRNRRAALRFFRKLLKGQGCIPRRLITDKLRSYPAACRTVMPSVVHCTDQYANNRHHHSGSLPPTDPATGTADAPVQICRPRATVSLGVRTHPESLSCRPPPRAGRPSSALANTGVRGLARGDVCLKLKNGSSPHRGRSLPVRRQLDNAYPYATQLGLLGAMRPAASRRNSLIMKDKRMVPRGRIELPTPRFSVVCSTN